MSQVWLITGAQGSGKSTVRDLLARRFEHGVHVRGGQFYRWAVNGWVHAGDPDQQEARRLLDLRYRLSLSVEVVEARDAETRRFRGKVACRGGFTPTINDQHLAATRLDLRLWIDASLQSPEEAVDEIVSRADEAFVT